MLNMFSLARKTLSCCMSNPYVDCSAMKALFSHMRREFSLAVCGVFSLITLNFRSRIPMRLFRGISNPDVVSYLLAR